MRLRLFKRLNAKYDHTLLLTAQLLDFMRMPISHGEGTHLPKVAAFASRYHIQTGFHGATDLSPINLAASLHFDLAGNNFGIQEDILHHKIVHAVSTPNYWFENGGMRIDDTPGIGVTLNEKKGRQYPYQAACLPVHRKLDKTMSNW